MPFQALRGFRDYLPADAAARKKVFETARAVVRRYGFEEVETPSVESLELIKAKSGDGIVAETFCFKDKGDREVTLVPENTPSLARLYVERAKIEPLPVKWAAYPRLWRYEEPQSGRLREFSQVSLDILGVSGVEAEVEVMETAQAIMDALGLAGRYVFRFSDRRLSEGIGRALGVQDPGPFFRALDRREKLPPQEFASELARAGVSPSGREQLDALLQRTRGGVAPPEAREVLGGLSSWPGMDAGGRAGIDGLLALLDRAVPGPLEPVLAFDPTIVRGLAYYTSTVFEAWARKGEVRALYGGGRYDGLIELFGGGKVPACGLAMGDQTLELLLREAGLWPERPPGLDVYVAVVDASLAKEARAWVLRLRSEGFGADLDLLARPLSRQMKEAARRGASWLVLLGPRELAKGEVTLRNMRTGQQAGVAASAVVSALRQGGDGAAPAPGSTRSPA